MSAAVLLKFWCRACGFKTAHRCLEYLQSGAGLWWECTRCGQRSEHSAAQAWTTERV